MHAIFDSLFIRISGKCIFFPPSQQLAWLKILSREFTNFKQANLMTGDAGRNYQTHEEIFDTVKSKQRFIEKVKDILIEICIIVFAVSLSIWLHSWSEHRHEQKEVSEFLDGLKGDLNKDIILLEKNKNIIARLDSNYHFLMSLRKDQAADMIHLEFALP